MIRIRAFRAIDEVETCMRYAAGHRQVLEGFKLTNITTNNNDWANNPNVYVIIAESLKTGHLLGGIRVQIAAGIVPLPVEDAVAHFDPKIHDMVRDFSENGGTGEICGLWNSREEAPQMGITLMLVLAGLAISNQLPITTLFTIVASYTLKIALQVGFKIERGVGINGEFVYPNSNYVARVLTMNPDTLQHTYQNYLQRINFLRENVNVVKNEITTKGEIISVHYELDLKTKNRILVEK
jgi:hypothetical protein